MTGAKTWMSVCTRMYADTGTCTRTLHMCTLLPKMCHQMSPPSASFNLAAHSVIILQMATSTFSVSIARSLFETHISTHFPCHFSLPPTSKSADLASVESISVSGSHYLPPWSWLVLWPSPTIGLFIFILQHLKATGTIFLLYTRRGTETQLECFVSPSAKPGENLASLMAGT